MDIGGSIPWRVASADYPGIIHLVACLNEAGFRYYEGLSAYIVCRFKGRPYALTFAFPKKVLTACDVWVLMTPFGAERRPATCLACLSV